MEFNVADLLERVADTVPDHLALVCGPRRLTLRRARRARQPARARVAGARRRPGRPRRAVPLQLHRVPRGDARRVQDPRGADQRELPLRRRGAAVSPRRRRCRRGRVPLRVRGEARRASARTCRGCAPSSRSTTAPTTRSTPTEATTVSVPSTTSARSRRVGRPATSRPVRPTISTCCTRAAPPACPRV